MNDGAAPDVTTPLKRGQPDSIHQRIRADIEGNIVSGVWPPGYRIPFEHELMQEYGCSRMTVNKVMSRLAEIGLIERRRRAGSFVARPQVQSAVLEIPDIKAEIIRRGQSYRYELLSSRRRRATREDRELLVVEAGTDVLVLTCRHVAAGVPFAFEERRLNLAAVPLAAEVDFAQEPPGTWLLGHVPWTQAEHRIRSLNAGEAYAEPLEISPETACLVVERRTWRGGESITHARQVFPGSLYYMSATFTPAQE
ncbi:MAG: histidine utilization repressor [Chelatococcus sp.]|jgi:GntR family histidine utilization transcriptional repressor|uniref:histidine utilization repressor n=1 Tax=unclassified Chelatococcus TaxID=2638111 RepID=UPI001BD08B6F|nr:MULTISPECIES: histidine utilization repressor [unclassified Chelatococcus]CAH1672653.1 Histidine utilization repressor [Hyphomicrobiales bacterium]MBS7738923.1 histidine utilization repressor [Chelatococcus sp. HY11]MBX3538960.1 histidine utilization repressor [Chelatococcus sp.]MBX3543356.1 histidine utilization repressor [Chelatococcus sp.]MCO5076548.1 histidine utilization repressor [Chelatococcus sp.]